MTRAVQEEWRPIPAHPGYEASSLGRVRSIDRIVTFTHLRQRESRRFPGVVLKSWPNSTGYPVVALNDRKRKLVHLLAADAFLGPCPVGYEVAHQDGDQANSAADNLRHKTHVENEADKLTHGTSLRGERHPGARLTKADAIRIRSLRGLRTQADIANDFGISAARVGQIQRGLAWKACA